MNSPDETEVRGVVVGKAEVVLDGEPQLPAPKNLLQKINAVRSAVHYVRKTKRVGEGGYLAVTHDEVTALTREAFIREGIVIVPSLKSSRVVLTGTTTAKNIPFIRYEATFVFTVFNVDNQSEMLTFELEAHAIDQGDKAPGKAISYAKKYAVLKLLEIESGEEEEEREKQKAGVHPTSGAKELLTPEQIEVCDELAGEIIDLLEADMVEKAAEKFYSANISNEEKVYVWTFFTRAHKRSMKDRWDKVQKAMGK